MNNVSALAEVNPGNQAAASPILPIIKVQQLTKTFRVGDVDVHALRGVNLTVAKGEFIAVVGSSGSGKSTLFNILGGLTPPTSGSVHIDNRDLAAMTNAERTDLRKRTVGFVFQKYNLLPTLTAEDNIRLVQYIGGRDNSGSRGASAGRASTGGASAPRGTAFAEPFQKVLDLLGIADRLQHKPRALSGGQQQRVAIARAIVNEPAILLADEPTGNLDSQNSAAVLTLLKDLNQRLGQTILMITHDPEAAAYADHIVHMRDGQVV
jgi:putative ABC transport system ATP-binding protein